MTSLDIFFHLVNFCLPAVFVSGALAVLMRKQNKRNLRQTWLINSAVGIAAMTVGLIFFRFDGKMLSYALLVVTCSLSQALLCRRK
jgi:hypothetical protein